MSKKLLSEAQVRRFMKLASVDHLADGVVTELGPGMSYARDDEEGMEDLGDLPAGEEEGGEDLGALGDLDADVADEGGELSLSDEEVDVLIAVGNKLEAARGPEEELADEDPLPDEGELGGAEDLEGEEDLESLEEVDLSQGGNKHKGASQDAQRATMKPLSEDAGTEADTEAETVTEEEEETVGDVEVVDEEELVNEITRRVAERLMKAGQKNS